MKAEKFSEALGNVRDDYVSEANTYKRAGKSLSWVKWGAAAACLCLVAAGSGVLISRNFNKPIDSNVTGGDDYIGDWSIGTGGNNYEMGGNESFMGGSSSWAVHPASEKPENVASAVCKALTEDELSGIELAKHLPKQLPDGFHFGRGWLYSTVMKDGTEYNMLRIEYISGWIQEQKFSEDGGAIAPEVWTEGENFFVCVTNYEPDTHGKYTPDPDEQPVPVIEEIYSSAEEVPLSLFEQHRIAYIRTGDRYVSVVCNTAEPTTVLEAVKSIK